VVKRLSVLAEIYRCARELWPLDIKQVGQNVTIRIDMIKSLSTQLMLEVLATGDLWLMVKHNKSEAFIERSPTKKLNKLITNTSMVQVMDPSVVLSYDD